MSEAAPEITAPAGDGGGKGSPILPLIVFGFGAYLLWFGVKYWKGSGAAAWPSYPIKSVLQGQGVPSNVPAVMPASAQLAAYETQVGAAVVGTGQAPGTHTAGGRGSGGGTPAPPAPPNIGGNVGTGRLMAGAYGWGNGNEWNSLYALWQQESGWSQYAKNPGSGAYGIAQALPPTKYPFPGQQAGGSSVKVQIAWGLAYIKSRYGKPSVAWAHEKAVGWY